MRSDADRYETYYAEKLWRLLPSIYRAEDGVGLDEHGPLRELVERIGAQAAIVRRSIDRMWEDQSIETCDEWVIAYIADLLATNLVSGLDAKRRRVDVAKTIYYRRRKGTVAVLEEIAHDITGWDARVAEHFRRLSRTRHGLDPALGWPIATKDPKTGRPVSPPPLQVVQGLVGRRTRTPAGGFADLRDAYGAAFAHTAFDEASHTADVRRGRGRTGWYNIPRLGVFVWRLRSVPADGVDPVAYAGCPGKLTFDPTGREIQLFAMSAGARGDAWLPPEEHQLPVPIRGPLLRAALTELYAAPDPADATALIRRPLGVYAGEVSVSALVPVERITADAREAKASWTTPHKKHHIDPERGRLFLAPGTDAKNILVSYRHGLASEIGAGGYDRRFAGLAPPDVGPAPPEIKGGDSIAAIGPKGTLTIGDSRTYVRVPDVPIAPGEMLVVKAGVNQRPLVRFRPSMSRQWTFTGSTRTSDGKRSSLWLDGLFVSGGDVALANDFALVTLTACSLDPGTWDWKATRSAPMRSADDRLLVASHLRIRGHVRRLVVDRSILGPIILEAGGSLETLVLRDSIVQASDPSEYAVDVGTGVVDLRRVTVLGRGRLHRLEASDAILHDIVTVEDYQSGCVRFSAWATGSIVPRRYESVEIAPRQGLFTSAAFGHHGYAQLHDAAPAAILAGAEDGSEMGAFSREQSGVKERGLLIKYREYMPVGLVPVVIHAT